MENYILSEDRRVGEADLENSMVFEDVEAIAKKMPFYDAMPEHQRTGFIEGMWQGIYILATPHQIQRMDVPLSQQIKVGMDRMSRDKKLEDLKASMKRTKRSLAAWIVVAVVLTFSLGFQVARLLLK